MGTSLRTKRSLSLILLTALSSGWKVIQTLSSKSTKLSKKLVRTSGTQSCKESTKRWVDNQEECQDKAECQVECQEVWAEWAECQDNNKPHNQMLMMLTDS